MYHCFLIHSSADGHLGCFHVLAIINSAAINIFLYFCGKYLFYTINKIYLPQRKAMPKNVEMTAQLHSSHIKVMLKILQARLQKYLNCELPEVQPGFRKGRGTRDQIANLLWIIKKAREFQENVYFCFTDYTKAFDCVDHNKLWKILKEMGIPDHLTCLL